MSYIFGLPELEWSNAMTPQTQPLESVENTEAFYNFCSFGDCVDVRLNEDVEPPVIEVSKSDDETVWAAVNQADFRNYVRGRQAGQLSNTALFSHIGGGLMHVFTSEEIAQFDADVIAGRYDDIAGEVKSVPDDKQASIDLFIGLNMTEAV